ncbi:MAG: DUF4410 domain-containing protein [Verrucomicrobiae bacterium]|nr:DUF4410 domain-containing protein [Verrucomicrobiae bacterium]
MKFTGLSRLFLAGAGGTKVETQVQVYDLSISRTKPFMTFQTTGGSGSEPGAISGTGAVDAAVSAATQSLGGLGADCQRTARMIAGQLSAYMTGRGWQLQPAAQPAGK